MTQVTATAVHSWRINPMLTGTALAQISIDKGQAALNVGT
jgi:hypothetical protein